MAFSEITINDIGKVRIFRRKGLKNIRITVNHDGSVRLSIPWYVPKSAGIRYLNAKTEWIKKHQKTGFDGWSDGQNLTKKYILKILDSTRKNVFCRQDEGVFSVYLPSWQSAEQKQASLDKHITIFLKREAEKELPPLLKGLAGKNGFKYKTARIKKLKSRWGSCNQNKIISLNLLLIRLPEDLCEYVMLHELSHTRHLNHSKEFWQQVETVLPDYKQRRKALRKFNPAVIL